jgi:hypothetical protein
MEGIELKVTQRRTRQTPSTAPSLRINAKRIESFLRRCEDFARTGAAHFVWLSAAAKWERAKVYSATVVLGLTFFLSLLFRMVYKISGYVGLIYFVLPAACLISLLIARESAGLAGKITGGLGHY